MKNSWHTYSIAEIEKELETDAEKGLSMRRARQRALPHSKRRSLFCAPYPSVFESILAVLGDPCMILLFAVSLLAVIFGGSLQGLFTLCLSLICAAVFVIMDRAARKRTAAASDYSSPLVRVVRGGDRFFVDGKSLVEGDVILIGVGDLVPCDARIVESQSLVVKELISTRSGVKNRTVEKSAEAEHCSDDAVSAPDACNMLYAGSAILSGNAKAIVTNVGPDVYLAEYLEDGELSRAQGERLVERELKSIAQKIRIVSLCAVPILLLISILTMRTGEFADSFMLMLSAIALISAELVTVGVRYVSSAYVHKLLPSQKRAKREGDLSCAVKSYVAADKLCDIDSLVIIGRAGITQSGYKIAGIYTADGLKQTLNAQNEHHNRLLTLIYTYVKTLEANGNEQDAVLGEVGETLVKFVTDCGFDNTAADIYLRSLYYVDDGNRGYVCAEAIERQFRVALTEDDEILDYCTQTRFEGEAEQIGELDVGYIKSLSDKTRKKGGMCLYVVSEDAGVGTLEGVIALEQPVAQGLEWSLSTLGSMGVETYIFLENEQEAELISDAGLADLYKEKIALAGDQSISDVVSQYKDFRAFAGFSSQQYSQIIDDLKQDGKRVAAFGIDNRNNDLLSKADVVISCDDLKYDSADHKDSAYAENLKSGCESSPRCSSQTRLLAGVIVKRAHSGGGGIASIIKALKSSREVSVSLYVSLKLFCNLMSLALPFAVITALSGVWLISPFQMLAIAAMAATLPFLLYAEGGCKGGTVRSPAEVFSRGLGGIVARAVASAIVAVLAAVLHYVGVLGEGIGFMGVTFVSILLSLFLEIAFIEKDFGDKGGAGRNRWMYVMLAYAFMLCLMGISTQDHLLESLYTGGVNLVEFIALPVYLLAFAAAILISRAKERNKK